MARQTGEAARATCERHELHLGLHTASAVDVAERSPLVSDAVDATVDHFQSSRQCLSAGEVRNRLAAYGPNVLAEGRRRSPWRMFVDQFKDFMILVLLVAAVISGLIGEAIDTIAIIAIVILNAVIGFIQE
jgi:magnesium-transporting ATPase (P-type)